jgi:hypothetical protein
MSDSVPNIFNATSMDELEMAAASEAAAFRQALEDEHIPEPERAELQAVFKAMIASSRRHLDHAVVERRIEARRDILLDTIEQEKDERLRLMNQKIDLLRDLNWVIEFTMTHGQPQPFLGEYDAWAKVWRRVQEGEIRRCEEQVEVQKRRIQVLRDELVVLRRE